MKIGIITLHSLDNPGSALQAFALQQFLKDNGRDAILIDYNPYYIYTSKHKIRTIIGKLLNWKQNKLREKCFSKFRKEYMCVTPVCYRSYKELEKNPPVMDQYIAGSDQIWNPYFDCGRDDAFYLRFVYGKPRLSYAASLGKDTFTDEEQEFITSRIKDFDFISVREHTSQIFLSQSGIKDVSYVCDPTLLLNVEQYRSLAKMPEKIPEKYLLVYLVTHSKLLDTLISSLKKKYGLKIVQIGSFLKHCDCDIMLKDAGPQEFVGLIANAACVVASSYHATVFSLIFHKQFYILPPQGNAARIESLLGLAGVDGRIIYSDADIEANVSINYDDVQKRLDEFIYKSKQSLLAHTKEETNEVYANL